MLPGVDHLPHTHDRAKQAFSRGQPEWGAQLADELERIVALHDASTIAAVIVEPMAGSTGVLVPPKGYLERLRQICDKHGILLIFDEVITGFGRLGASFAAERFGVVPDMITCAKGLTNGTVPMGGVIVRRGIYDAFMTGPEHRDRAAARLHLFGPSARRRGGARDARHLSQARICSAAPRRLEPYWEDAVHSLKGLPHVVDIRNLGLVAGIELDADRRQAGGAGVRCLPQMLRARAPGPHHRRHHRAVAAADHRRGRRSTSCSACWAPC